MKLKMYVKPVKKVKKKLETMQMFFFKNVSTF